MPTLFCAGMAKGFTNSLVSSWQSIKNFATNPVGTVKGIGRAIYNYEQTFAAIRAGIGKRIDMATSGNPFLMGQVAGEGVALAGSVVLTRGTGTLAKSGVRLLKVGDNVADAARTGNVIIGETMKRVEMTAAKNAGSIVLDDMPDFSSMGLKTYQVTNKMMEFNRKWILKQLRSGKTIKDIGVDPSRKIPSIFYQMEQNMIKNYQKLHPEWNNITRK